MMKTDLYSKIVLTVIAASLVIIVLRDINITPTATAQTSSRAMDVNLVSVNGTKLYGGLNVNVKNRVAIDVPLNGLDVNVRNNVKVNWSYSVNVSSN